MSLSAKPVLNLLETDFVVGWENIQREDYVGSSHGYTTDEVAVGTTNGAGPRNMQTFVLSGDGTVMHCLPGFWHPDDLVVELHHGKAMHRLWNDRRPKSEKRKMFSRMMIAALRTHPAEMTARSGWQGFDANNERNRLEQGLRDTFFVDEHGKPTELKPLNVVVHERMAKRPFVSFKSFDTEEFIDYGRPYYDNNRGKGVGVDFGSDGYMDSQRRMAEKRAEREARKARDKEAIARRKKEEARAKAAKKSED